MVDLEEQKKKLLSQLTEKVTSNINDLVKDKQQQVDENGKKKAIKDIASDLGISNQALANYTSDRLPEYKQLAFIRNYFSVPYSYIFGEANNKKIENTSIGMTLGLTDSAIEKLSHYKKVDNSLLLFIINNIIENEDLTRNIGNLLIQQLSFKEVTKKYAPLNIFDPNRENRQYEYMLYRFSNRLDTFINTLVEKEDIPTGIIKKVERMPSLDTSKKRELDRLLDEYNNLDSK